MPQEFALSTMGMMCTCHTSAMSYIYIYIYILNFFKSFKKLKQKKKLKKKNKRRSGPLVGLGVAEPPLWPMGVVWPPSKAKE
jgi:hypothetical protein